MSDPVALRPVTATPPSTADDDPRVGHLLGRGEEWRVTIVGFPSDEGVRRNGGRPGAAAGPGEIRRWLDRLTADPRSTALETLLAATRDLGDVDVSGDLERDQEALGAVVAAQLAADRWVVVLGGGHEVAYGHFLGYALAGRGVEILNWDAHADVRDLVAGAAHSGSPFRQALEHPSGLCAGYTVAGLQPHSVAVAHRRFLEERGARVVWREQVGPETPRALIGALRRDALVTFDLDALDQSVAPGVSAPATGGLDLDLWLRAAEEAGRSPRVRSIDVAELAPELDRDGQTARVAALTVWRFLRGLAERAAASTNDRR
ncbi:MAG TPA: formimidoylglutamase [Thermoanaerobaculia bacterium]|nr:formimidoylglutamase [Thermoanaerobaculia bacterium]